MACQPSSGLRLPLADVWSQENDMAGMELESQPVVSSQSPGSVTISLLTGGIVFRELFN